MSIIVFMDGVIRTEVGVPIYEGLYLYHSLNLNSTVMLACKDAKEGARWCKEHKLGDVDGFLSDDLVPNFDNKDYLKIQQQLAAGPVQMVVTTDVNLAKTCLENGVKALLFLNPIYLNAKFRPDGREGRKSWDELVQELDRQIELHIEDNRL